MRLQEFIKNLFNQQAVAGFELGQVDIDVCVKDDILYVGGDSLCAKITIVPSELKEKKNLFSRIFGFTLR